MRKFKDIPGSNYRIYDDGELVNILKNTPRKSCADGQGYLRTRITIDGVAVNKRIHRLVAQYFIPQNNPEQINVNHINGIKSDNRVENLEWVTNSENMSHAKDNNLMRKGLNREQSKFDDCRLLTCYTLCHSKHSSVVEIAALMEVTKGSISAMLGGSTYKDIYESIFDGTDMRMPPLVQGIGYNSKISHSKLKLLLADRGMKPYPLSIKYEVDRKAIARIFEEYQTDSVPTPFIQTLS